MATRTDARTFQCDLFLTKFISKINSLNWMVDKELTLNGIVSRGMGEGTYFMSMKEYRNQIQNQLGFIAYPGTLNLITKKKQAESLKNLTPIRLSGFNSGKQAFGGASCYKAEIKDVEGAIIVPDFSRHKEDIIEFIAPVHLRSSLSLKDGDKVDIVLTWRK